MEQSRYMLKMVRRLTQQLSVKLLQFVFAGVEVLVDAKVGTMCSGTDCHILVMRALQQTLAEDFRIDWNFEHEFSAERCPGKQSFIQALTGGLRSCFQTWCKWPVTKRIA